MELYERHNQLMWDCHEVLTEMADARLAPELIKEISEEIARVHARSCLIKIEENLRKNPPLYKDALFELKLRLLHDGKFMASYQIEEEVRTTKIGNYDEVVESALSDFYDSRLEE